MSITVNFFWSGDSFTFLHHLTILSHIKVGHKIVIWLHGDEPNSLYWITDNFAIRTNGKLIVRNADDIINISEFMNKGGNFKTASSLWRFTFLYEYGGWYSDMDAIAIKNWGGITNEWMLCRSEDGFISTGVLKVPKKRQIFLKCIDNIKYKWGNVNLFNKIYDEIDLSVEVLDSKYFYPYQWTEWDKALHNNPIPDCYSVHLYHTMYERYERIFLDGKDDIKGVPHSTTLELYLKENPDCMLSQIKHNVESL